LSPSLCALVISVDMVCGETKKGAAPDGGAP
jgi:hypothetical protein